jgi:hypothetical protein
VQGSLQSEGEALVQRQRKNVAEDAYIVDIEVYVSNHKNSRKNHLLMSSVSSTSLVCDLAMMRVTLSNFLPCRYVVSGFSRKKSIRQTRQCDIDELCRKDTYSLVNASDIEHIFVPADCVNLHDITSDSRTYSRVRAMKAQIRNN